jgi:hypothetical protein
MRQSLQASGYEVLDLIGEGAYGVVWHVFTLYFRIQEALAHHLLHSQFGSAHTHTTQSRYQTYHSVRPYDVLPQDSARNEVTPTFPSRKHHRHP